MASSDGDRARAAMRMSPPDNVAVALRPLKAGETIALDGTEITVGRNLAVGHKFAARAIATGEIVIKYGCPIGVALSTIAPGESLDTRNVETRYLPTIVLPK